MIAYAATATTKRNLAYLRETGWRLMLSSKGILKPQGMKFALDNGAWWCYQHKQPFDSDAFMRALDTFWFDADFIVLPDIVAGGRKSLDFSLEWHHRLNMDGLLLLPVQDGMTTEDVKPYLPEVGIFIGGTTEFKEQTMFEWAALAQSQDSYIHCGRVNSQRRLNMCKQAGIDSFDGSGPSKFQLHAELMNRELNQHSLQFR